MSEEDWQRIRRHYGDLAYEHPELHAVMLEILNTNDPPDAGDELK